MHETRPKFIQQYTKSIKCIYTIKPSKRDENEKNQVPVWVQIHQGSLTNIGLHRFFNIIFFDNGDVTDVEPFSSSFRFRLFSFSILISTMLLTDRKV